jgi:hypothetical protein
VAHIPNPPLLNQTTQVKETEDSVQITSGTECGNQLVVKDKSVAVTRKQHTHN